MTPEQIAPAWNAWWSSVSTGANDKHMQTAFEAGYLAALKTQQPGEDVVERVAELQLASFLAGRGSVKSMKYGTRWAERAPSMDEFRRMATAAMQESRDD